MKISDIATLFTALWPAVKWSLDERKKRKDLEARVKQLEEAEAERKKESDSGH